MRLLSTRTIQNEVAKHKTMLMRLLSTRTMANDVAQHKNNESEAAKLENDGK